MSLVDWIIAIVPLAFVVYMGFYSRRYIKGVSDYLAAGRVAGRYVITVSDIAEGLAVLTLIGCIEVNYKVGFAIRFWNSILTPLMVFLGLTGFMAYRFRETKCLSMGQFLEMRYNRPLRIYASTLRSVAELLANCICPALAARFAIYYLGFPQTFELFGIQLPTFLILTFFMTALCVIVCCCGGCLALIITDTIQGFICYPLLIVFTIFVIVNFSWSETIVPVMSDRVAGESFLNPFDVAKMRDFNLFALVVTFYATIINRGNWYGSGSNIAAKSPHEQKMAGLMGTWRGMFTNVFYTLMVLMVIAFFNHNSFAVQAKAVRDKLSETVLSEVGSGNPELQMKVLSEIKKLPPTDHVYGGTRPQDAPLSHTKNLDTPLLETVKKGFAKEPRGAQKYQEFFTLYHQMMLPIALRQLLPVGMVGLFALFVLLMMLSTDDSRLFSSAQTIVQDCILPFCKKGISMEKHVFLIRLVCVGCGIFWLLSSFFMAQLDYINMFVTIMCSMWIGAGPMVFFGLYSRFGNTTGAFASLISGMVLSLSFIFLQRNWAGLVYPWLEANNWHLPVGEFLAACSAPFEPWIVWRMAAHKFPINSIEINFIVMIICLFMYIAGSLLTYRKPFNLDRMLHRGIYNTDGHKQDTSKWSVRTVLSKLIGITPQHTKSDRIISWSVFIYTFIYKFLIGFILVVICNLISPWPIKWWGHYYFITAVAVPLVAAAVTTVWFTFGGIRDMRQLFKDLSNRLENPLDNGQVEGEISLADSASFAKLDEGKKEDKKSE